MRHSFMSLNQTKLIRLSCKRTKYEESFQIHLFHCFSTFRKLNRSCSLIYLMIFLVEFIRSGLKLDTSMTNHKLRILFLLCMSTGILTPSNPTRKYSTHRLLISWIVTRNLKLTNIHVADPAEFCCNNDVQ